MIDSGPLFFDVYKCLSTKHSGATATGGQTNMLISQRLSTIIDSGPLFFNVYTPLSTKQSGATALPA
jgi:hypothetical protein